MKTLKTCAFLGISYLLAACNCVAATPHAHEAQQNKSEWVSLALLNSSGALTTQKYQAALRQRAIMLKDQVVPQTASGAQGSVIEWTSIGPDNVGGRINDIWIDPSNAQHILAASASGGVWQSTDGGQSWSALSGFPGSLATSAIAQLPNGTLLVGTGDFNTAPGDGIIEETAGSQTWLPLSSTAATNSAEYWLFVNSLAVAPPTSTNSDGVILAATGAKNMGVPGGIERSTDNGQTWTSVWPTSGTGTNGSSSASFDVAFDPENPNSAIADDDNGGVIYSTDGGNTWALGSGISAESGTRTSVAFDPSVPGSAYALVDNNDSNLPSGVVYHSTDGGQTWTLLAGTSAFVNQDNGQATGALCDTVASTDCQGWYDNVITVLPHASGTPATIVVGGIDIFTSTDGGSTWKENGSWIESDPDYLHADQHAFAYDAGSGELEVGNDGGFYTQATSSTWTELNQGLADTQFYSIDGHSGVTASDDVVNGSPITPIAAGAQDNGTLIYEGYSANGSPQPDDWVSMFGGDGGITLIDPNDGNNIYGEYGNMSMFYSFQGGQNAQMFSPEPSDSGSKSNFIAPLALVPNNGAPSTEMLAGGSSLWLGQNLTTTSMPSNGSVPVSDATWSAIAAPIGGSDYISAIGIDPSNPNDVWVGYDQGEVSYSSNALSGNPTWSTPTTISSSISGGVSSFWFVPNVPGTVYATFNGYNSYGTSNVWVTTNGGQSWSDVGSGLPDAPVYSLVSYPGNPQIIYVGSLTGVYTSSDGGQTWLASNIGPANVIVRQLKWFDDSNPSNPVLLAATFGRGAFLGSPNTNPTPTISSISPNTVQVGSSDTSVTITGSGFVPNLTTATLNGESFTVNVLSSTEITASVPAADFSSTGLLTFNVDNPAPGGGESNGASISVYNPVPVLDSISPNFATSGSAATTIAVSGSEFEPNSVVDWNGTALNTTYQSATSLSATIPADDLASETMANVTVTTPAPGGGTSTADTFTVSSPQNTGGGGHGGGGALGAISLAALLMLLMCSRRRNTDVSPHP